MLSGLENFHLDILYILSQVFALVGTIFVLIAVQKRKKIQLINYDVIGVACAILHYMCLGAWSGVASKSVSLLRDIIAAYGESHQQKFSKKKLEFFAVAFVAFYVIGGVLVYESVFSLLPIIGVAIYTTAIYLGEVNVIRYAAGASSLMWLIYNIHVFSIVGIIAEAIFIINDIIAIWRYRKKNNKKRRHKSKKSKSKKRK